MKELTGIFSSIGKLYTEKRELAAVWVTPSVMTGKGKQSRICEDCEVWMENGSLINGSGSPTHKVLACRGTLVNQFELNLENIETKDLITIKL